MANDISGINSSRSQQTSERNVTNNKKDTSATGKSSSARSARSSSRDRVSLTDTAERLKALEQQLTQQPEIDRNRVNRVQDAITNGEYRVDPKRVADKMMNFEASFDK